jgi:hypothetical protein
VSSVNQLITRETLIKEVWNDYGGGDEGLNQAISFLRKLFGDTNKKIIETVPTKGYILRAVISDDPAVIKHSNRKRNYWIGGMTIILIAMSLYLLFWRSNDSLNSIPQPSIKLKVNPNITIKLERKPEPRPALPPRDEDSLRHK